ncbi:LicD family protein [Bifidobacterium sp. ESL0704]|uniref:LicD family protein n=1 Tax=Bifidobacterium sp. ESL0704 TaxID=2983219 RepID=UPI0023F88158|nr:LicD family protein [Bifidobacterium sp. ESL0704]WEV52731.1 LicD family protein [Bifidobacterium sp. ESL0704]
MHLSTVDQFKHIDNAELITLDDEQLFRLQRVLLMMARDIIGYCEENNINYHLGGGTALGAMRHKGFIPWDDDMDINMPRADYDAFISGFARVHKDKYVVESPEQTPNYRSWGARVRLKGTRLKDREDIGNNNVGVWVDIFPVENTYDNVVMRDFHGFVSMALGFICSCTRTHQDRNYYYELAGDNADLRKSLQMKSAIGALFSFRSFNKWMKTSVKWYARCKNDDTRFVVIPSGRKHFFGEIYLRRDMVRTKKQPFEGEMWNVPVNVERYLTKLYGDWNRLPSLKDREHHAFFAFDLGKYGTDVD